LPAGNCEAGDCDFMSSKELRTLKVDSTYTPQIADKFELTLRFRKGHRAIQGHLPSNLEIRNPQPQQEASSLRIEAISPVSRNYRKSPSIEVKEMTMRFHRSKIRDLCHCLRSSADVK
jgi:hypothetical protein